MRSAVIDYSMAPPLAVVGAGATRMVFPFQSAVVHCSTGCLLASDAVTLAMLWRAGRVWCVGDSVSVEAGRGAMGVCKGCSLGLLIACCLGICLLAAAAATPGSEISGRGVAIAVGVNVRMAFFATILRTSLVRSANWFQTWMLSTRSWSTILLVWSPWMLVKVNILEVQIVSFF